MSRDPAEVPCTLVRDQSQLDDLSEAMHAAERLAIDTEVPVDGPRAGRLRVMSVATRAPDGAERAFVVDARDVDPVLLGAVLTGLTADAWNAGFDARVLDRAVWHSDDTTAHLTWWDAQLADALIHQGRSGFSWYHGLAWATSHYLGIEAEGKGTVQLSYTAEDDLTGDQVAYAAADAVETLWVSDAIRRELSEAGLEEITRIELAARPFLDRMERSGLPFDWPGWRAELLDIERQQRSTIGRLADLTGGGQGTLFDDVVEPTWNPGSDQQVRWALNRHSNAQVRAFTAERYGNARDLDDNDSVTASVLREIGGDLCAELLEYRNQSKILSTYGESIHDHLHADGRLRPQYLQVVGTNTGRLASRNPNAQNLSPRMKPFVRPSQPERVFVHGDLSQAELRYLAQVSDDEALRAAFARGDDVHVTTAASMFGIDPASLRRDDPARLKHLRQIAKALNFGIAYGSGAASLARSLSAEGADTTVEQARELLAQYRATYPGTAAWAEARVAEIAEIREQTAAIDWALTLRLAKRFADVASIRREFRKTRNRWPNAAEIADVWRPVAGHEDRELVERIAWVLRYSAPVALCADGQPFTFASRTLAGRRQQFNIHLDRLFLLAVLDAIAAPAPELIQLRRRFENEHGIALHRGTEVMAEGELKRQFEDRSLRRRYIELIVSELGADIAAGFLARAAKERVTAMVNAWRNAPIQGGVADIMLVAYADLHRRLCARDGALPVQTVHDSIVVECNRPDAEALAHDMREALEQASLRFCPDVVPRADVDIRTSLADSDVLAPAP